MALTVQTLTPGYYGSRPLLIPGKDGKARIAVNKNTGFPQVETVRGLRVNSLLRADEWRAMDADVLASARTRLNGIQLMKSRGLVKPLPSFGILTSQWSRSSEMAAAQIDMTGQGRPQRDRVIHSIAGVPVPIIWKDFVIPVRELEASRLMGAGLDTEHATEAGRVVAEAAENLRTNGDSGVVFDGNTLYGLTTHPSRNTGSATGDWGTISNILPTVASMIALAIGDRYYGPYILEIAATQYNEANTSVYSDGSGQTALNRIKQIAEIQDVIPSDTLAAGSAVLYQASKDVIDWAEHMDITVVEWMTPDGMNAEFRVMMVATPRIKADYSGRSGVVHFTGL